MTFGRESIEFLNKNPILYEQYGVQKIMQVAPKEKNEDRHVRADRIVREHISAERKAREKKTARLREMRLKMEKLAA